MDSSIVTVLIPVYNGAKYLREAIESILNQTYSNFELLIINDGSTDHSEEIILSYSDPRIRYLSNSINQGLINTLNLGLRSAKGKYIARMDQDDISLPNRIEKQVDFLENNSEIGLVGTAFQIIGDEKYHAYYSDHDHIKLAFNFYNAIAHPTVMFRSEICKEYSLFYRREYIHAEDYKLWTDFILKTKVANMPEVLIKYRKHDTQICNVYSVPQYDMTVRIQKEYLLNNGFSFSDTELNLIQKLHQPEGKGNLELFMLMDKFYSQNLRLLFFDVSILSSFLLKIYKENILEIVKVNKNLKSYLKTSILYHKLEFSQRQKMSLKLKFFKNNFK